jgi:hypothetical protein
MGWIRDTKAKMAADNAARAWQEGHAVFVWNQNIPLSMATMSGPVPDTAEVIQSIEAVGWGLQMMQYADMHAKNGSIILLFRRPLQQHGTPPVPAAAATSAGGQENVFNGRHR